MSDLNAANCPTNDDDNSFVNSLDVASEHFNPLHALYAADYKITKKSPKVIYQNVAAFESALKKFGIWQLNKPQNFNPSIVSNKAVSSSLKESKDVTQRFEPSQMTVTCVAKKNRRNIFTHMAGAEGPLATLQKLLPTLEEGKRHSQHVRVLVRKEKIIGGTIEGELIAYDKQWNLLLKNAVETWQRRKFNYGDQKMCGTPQNCDVLIRQMGISLPNVQVTSLNRKNVQLRREISQVLVRGENIVLISLISKQ